jgi:Cu+-exporting ATPase
MTTQYDSLVTLDVTGMTCAACAARVESVLRGVDGVAGADVSQPLERADIRLARPVSPATLVQAVEHAGYHAAPRGFGSAERREARQARNALKLEERRVTLRIATVAVLTALPFLVDMAYVWTTGAPDHLLPPWLQALLATIAQAFCGWRFYRGAWSSLKGGFANMDVLIAIGTSAAYGLSLYNWLAGHHAHGAGLYFEAGTAILAFVLIGKVLEGQAKSGASEALEALAASAPRKALKLADGKESEVEAATLLAGDRVVIRPGALSPVDGVVVEGAAAFDESLLTGESLPVVKQAGDRVVAGSVASGGRVIVEVVATGDDTRLQRIARLVEDAEISKSPSQRLADRISAIFVAAVMAVALLCLVGWLMAGSDLDHALIIAVSVLVVACPCALGLATPIALVAGANAAAKSGLIVTDHAALEAAGRVTRVVFDKTGTLTLGAPAVAGVHSPGEGADALSLAASIARASDHPLDHALVAEAGRTRAPLKDVTGLTATPGRGVEATVAGRRLRLGNAAFVAEAGVSGDSVERALADPAMRTAGSVAFLAEGDTLLGAFGFADQPRAEVASALAALSREDIATTVLSGDRQAAVDAFGGQFGLKDARGGLKPEDKIRAVNGMRKEGEVVAVVGDGVNDAPALRAADVGVAMGTGTEAAKAAAAVTLARPDPRLVASLIEAGRATRATIAQNLAFAFVFNGVGIPLAAAGKLSPALAGAAMALSSVSVVLNAWRLSRRRFGVTV